MNIALTPSSMIDAEHQDTPSPPEIGFHYIKSPIYRTVHADGAYGGVTPVGLIEMTLFSERFPIPKYTRHQIVDGKLVPIEINREVKDGIVRELEVGAVMSIETATLIRDWLNEQIAKLAGARAERTQGGA